MTDGRVFTLEDEIDVIHEDLGRARRAYETAVRAPYDGRVTDPIRHEDTVSAAFQRVRVLERELADAQEAQRLADEAS